MKHYDFIESAKDSKPADEKVNWMSKLATAKVKGSKWQHFPAVIIPFAPDYTIYDDLKDFKVYDDDVFMCGFMRSGTTLMQEMIWLIVNDCDFARAKSVPRAKRFPYFEGHDIRREIIGEHYEKMENMERPRCLKTHFPVQCLPDDIWQVQPKIIHMSRDVKDVVASLYYYSKDFVNLESTFDEFCVGFLNDSVFFGPYREHYYNYINLPNYPNILYLTYEYVTQNMDEAIHKVAEFLGKEISSENLKLLKEHMQFDNMKKNPAAHNDEYLEKFNKLAGGKGELHGQIRNGKIGGYKKDMSPKMSEKFDKWMDEGIELNQGFRYKSQ